MSVLSMPATGGSSVGSVADLVELLAGVEVGASARAQARHRLADTGFAVAAGLRTEQGGRSVVVGDALFGRESLAGRAYRFAAGCRMTEIDDVDLLSCTTPGAVVVPTVLAMIGSGRSQVEDLDAVLDAVALGYEVMLGLGESLNGPRRLAAGVWPSLAAGAVTAAVVTTLLLGGDLGDAKDAAMVAAQQSVIGNPRGLSREHLFGGTVVTGIGSALAVRKDFRPAGDREGGALGRLLSEPVDATAAARVGRPGVKQVCSARQTMAAIAAVRHLVETHGLSADTIEEIDVGVPLEYAAMLDKPTVHTRRESISSAPYQLALALRRPEGLRDVDRSDLGTEPLADLMARIRVHGSAELSKRYPRQWPARVRLVATGATYETEALTVPGEDDLSTDALVAKVAAFAAVNPTLSRPAETVGRLVDDALEPAHLVALAELVDRP